MPFVTWTRETFPCRTCVFDLRALQVSVLNPRESNEKTCVLSGHNRVQARSLVSYGLLYRATTLMVVRSY